MKRIGLFIILPILLLTGCATNISYVEGHDNDFEWSKEYADWKIASDYYHLKNRLPGITYAIYGYPKFISPNKVDDRIVQQYAKALALKGYSADQISDYGKNGVSVLGMPEKMYNNWIATSSEYDLANDLLILCGSRSGSYRVLPAGKEQKKEHLIAMYQVALAEKGWSAIQTKNLMNNKICQGMPMSAVRVILGDPDTINKSNYGALRTEQWIWTSGKYQLPDRYVHFNNGRVSSFTEIDVRH